MASSWESGIVPVAVDQRVTEILDEDGTNLLQPDRYSNYGTRLDAPKGRVKREVVYVPLQPGAKGQSILVRDLTTARIMTSEVVDKNLLQMSF